jgi:hypothetical protein
MTRITGTLNEDRCALTSTLNEDRCALTSTLNEDRCVLTSTLNEDRCALTITSRSFLLRMRNVSGEIGTEHQNTHFMFNNFFFRKSFGSWANVEKYCRTVQASDDNIAHAQCMLDT